MKPGLISWAKESKLNPVSFLAAVVLGGALLPPIPAAGQAPSAPSVCPDDNHAAFHACAMEKAKGFTPPRTPDGKPDLAGLWRRRAAAHEDLEAHPKNPDDSGGPSVVVDPPDGKVPMQPWSDAKRRENAQKFLHHNAACYLSGVPTTMYMTGLYQFLQTATHLVVLSEEAHAYRVIPFDGRPHIGKDILLFQGDSRGRWDGNTLIVDTTNQGGQSWLDQRGRFYTEEARMTERFTLVDANTLHYSVTVDDPNVYTRPFTLAVAFRRNTAEGVEVWEEACHENNEESMEQFRNVGLAIYRGITAREAKDLKKAWEARGR
jgi:hypothetical protein